ncbi:MAG TPA: response regulator transcription factor [Anaerolineales bacterium]|nr:response regulator transcription factor [Anaerolineales bacterium]HMV98270.1 response regulator transcription factor [Anaerolineales bacterium]HMX20499.1 response regulator transcription factor [Anaerolineales bacterium]HMX73534.1 response regulator transcription factor [Anaerolineales bacterium]HMZ44299.1 response regulator transcription factor [Anaerolineales bacterium]
MPKIMIVDDDPQVITLLKRYLSVEGYEVIATTHSAKAVPLANTEHPDLFILDLMMPPPDGFTLCSMLRADPAFRLTPILIITAMADSNSKATSFGANDYLAKPFNLDELSLRISTLLNG